MAALAVEIGQMFIGSGTPEITDALLAFMAVVIIGSLSRPASRMPRSTIAPAPKDPSVLLPQPPATVLSSSPPKDFPPLHRDVLSWRRLLLFLFGCLAIAMVLYFGLKLPNIPYNVKELFGGADSWGGLFLFAAAGLSVGTASALAGSIAAVGRFAYLTLPLIVIPSCYVIFKMLDNSVSDESLYDIIGVASNLQKIETDRIWGDAGIALLNFVGSLSALNEIEYGVRFIALSGHVVLISAIAFASFVAASRQVSGTRNSLAGPLLKQFAIYGLYGLPWIILFKLIVVDYANTDNLVELIGDGGFLLYPLLLLLAANAVALTYASRSYSIRQYLLLSLFLLVSLPIGWFLFNNGLRSDVPKYGLVFSGAQFLLGGNRTQLFSDAVLMPRWFFVQAALVFGLACGMRIIAPRIRHEVADSGHAGNPLHPAPAQAESEGRRSPRSGDARPSPLTDGGTVGQTGEVDEPSPGLETDVVVVEQVINLRPQQEAFITDLSSQLETSVSESIQMIFDTILSGDDEWHQEAAENEESLSSPDTIEILVGLRNDQIAELNALSKSSGESVSRLARLAVDSFILNLDSDDASDA